MSLDAVDKHFSTPSNYYTPLLVTNEFLDGTMLSGDGIIETTSCSRRTRIKFEMGLEKPISIPLVVRDYFVSIDIGRFKDELTEYLGVAFDETKISQSEPHYFLDSVILREGTVAEKLLKFRELGECISSPGPLCEEAEPPPVSPPKLQITPSISSEYMCCICLEIMIDPSSLDCGHSGCKECLKSMVSATRGDTSCPICRASVSRNFEPKVTVTLRKAILRLFAEDPEYSNRLASVVAPSHTQVRCVRGHALTPVTRFFPSRCTAVGGCTDAVREYECISCDFGLCRLCYAHQQTIKAQPPVKSTPSVPFEQRLTQLYSETNREWARERRRRLQEILDGRVDQSVSPDRAAGWIGLVSRTLDSHEGDGVLISVPSDRVRCPPGASFVRSGDICNLLTSVFPALPIPEDCPDEFNDTLNVVDTLVRDTVRLIAVEACVRASSSIPSTVEHVSVRAEHVEQALHIYQLPALGVSVNAVDELLIPWVRKTVAAVTGGRGTMSGCFLRGLTSFIKDTLISLGRVAVLCALQEMETTVELVVGSDEANGASKTIMLETPPGAQVSLWFGPGGESGDDMPQEGACHNILLSQHLYRAIDLTLSSDHAENIKKICREKVACCHKTPDSLSQPTTESLLTFPPHVIAYIMQQLNDGVGPLKISSRIAVAMSSFIQQSCERMIQFQQIPMMLTGMDVYKHSFATTFSAQKIAPPTPVQTQLYREFTQHLVRVADHSEHRILVCPYTGMFLFAGNDCFKPLSTLDAACELTATERVAIAQTRLTRIGKELLAKVSTSIPVPLMRQLHRDHEYHNNGRDNYHTDLDPSIFCAYVKCALQSSGRIKSSIPSSHADIATPTQPEFIWSKESLVALQIACEWYVKTKLTEALAFSGPLSFWAGIQLKFCPQSHRLSHLMLTSKLRTPVPSSGQAAGASTISADTPASSGQNADPEQMGSGATGTTTVSAGVPPQLSIAAGNYIASTNVGSAVSSTSLAGAEGGSTRPVLCPQGHLMMVCNRIGTDWSCNMLTSSNRCLSGSDTYLTASNTVRYRCSEGCDHDYCQQCYLHHQSGQIWPVVVNSTNSSISSSTVQMEWPVRGRGRGGWRGRGQRADGAPWSDAVEARRLSEGLGGRGRRGRGRGRSSAPFAAGRTLHESVQAGEFRNRSIFSESRQAPQTDFPDILSDDDEL